MGAHREPVVLDVAGLQALVDVLRARGHTVVGPTVRDGAVVLGEIVKIEDLPAGVGDEQAPGRYRLRSRDDDALFGYAVPADSAKRWFFPPAELIVAQPGGRPEEPDGAPRPIALFGVRSCDLVAVAIHDRVLAGRSAVDVRYVRRRAGAVVVAVTCAEPGATCFCAGLGTGPDPASGYDVKITELLGSGPAGHRFVVSAGSATGERLLTEVPSAAATSDDLAAVADLVRGSAARQTRRLPTDGLREALYAAAEHPRWAEVATRCLACANCTLVCPTCFCTSVEDTSDLSGSRVERRRVWDSCFTADFSYLHGGSVRDSVAARYRQWVTHKLAAWTDQFGTLGCVGCGRCVTWCPAGIDLLAEVAAVRSPWVAPSPVTAPAAAATDGPPW